MGNPTPDPYEIPLSGEKLDKGTSDLNIVNQVGQNLFKASRDFIKEKVPDNWYAVIEPESGIFIASEDPTKLYQYTSQKYPNRLFYIIGLLKNS